MAIRKESLTEHYASIPNATLRDSRLSLDTVGLLSVLLSRPEDWIIRVTQIKREFGIGDVVQQRIFGELERAGYLVRKVARDGYGRWTTGITIYQVSQKSVSAEDGFSGNGSPDSGQSDTGSHGPLSKKLLTKTDSKIR